MVDKQDTSTKNVVSINVRNVAKLRKVERICITSLVLRVFVECGRLFLGCLLNRRDGTIAIVNRLNLDYFSHSADMTTLKMYQGSNRTFQQIRLKARPRKCTKQYR